MFSARLALNAYNPVKNASSRLKTSKFLVVGGFVGSTPSNGRLISEEPVFPDHLIIRFQFRFTYIEALK